MLGHIFETRSHPHPGPLPATPRGGTLVLDMAPQRMRTSSPKRRSRLSQERLGSAPKNLRGQVLVPTAYAREFRGGAAAKERGNMRPKIFPRSLCWRRRRPSISCTRLSGRPKSCRACSRASIARCAWRGRAGGVLRQCDDGAVWLWHGAFDRLWCSHGVLLHIGVTILEKQRRPGPLSRSFPYLHTFCAARPQRWRLWERSGHVRGLTLLLLRDAHADHRRHLPSLSAV